MIAIVGPTGAGKTTIINLIPRFYDPTAGRITIDGRDLRDVTLASLRDQISTVLQETTLFATTIRENIAFGRPDASFESIVQAARQAQAHDFIEAFPQGYETPVGERGVTLSGGQKQRVAIARALLKDPRILILDDATSSVDPTKEHEIRAALAEVMHGRTTIIIAHRPATIALADRVVLIDGGRIIADGTHDGLLESSAEYREVLARAAVEDEQRARQGEEIETEVAG